MKHVLINNGVVIAAGEGVEFGHVGADDTTRGRLRSHALRSPRRRR